MNSVIDHTLGVSANGCDRHTNFLTVNDVSIGAFHRGTLKVCGGVEG